MAFRFLLRCGTAPCAALLVGIGPFSAEPGAAQALCDDPDVTVLATAPSLDGYDLLFRQNAVSLYARLPARDSVGPATVLIRNGNRYPVEVSYGVELRLQGDAGTRTISLGRHCARIGPQGYALSTEEAPAQTAAVRVRNLTISNLADAPAQPRPTEAGAATPDPRTANPGEQRSDATRAEAGSGDSAASLAAPQPFEAARVPGSDTVGPAEVPGVSREPVPVRLEEPPTGWGAAVIGTATRMFQLLAMVVLTLAGLALLPPVMGTLYLLVLAVVLLAARVLGIRSR